jgi:hypothetical protein
MARCSRPPLSTLTAAEKQQAKSLDNSWRLHGHYDPAEERRKYSGLIYATTGRTDALKEYILSDCPNIIAHLSRWQKNIDRCVKSYLKKLEKSRWAVSTLDLDLAFRPDVWAKEHFLKSVLGWLDGTRTEPNWAQVVNAIRMTARDRVKGKYQANYEVSAADVRKALTSWRDQEASPTLQDNTNRRSSPLFVATDSEVEVGRAASVATENPSSFNDAEEVENPYSFSDAATPVNTHSSNNAAATENLPLLNDTVANDYTALSDSALGPSLSSPQAYPPDLEASLLGGGKGTIYTPRNMTNRSENNGHAHKRHKTMHNDDCREQASPGGPVRGQSARDEDGFDNNLHTGLHNHPRNDLHNNLRNESHSNLHNVLDNGLPLEISQTPTQCPLTQDDMQFATKTDPSIAQLLRRLNTLKKSEAAAADYYINTTQALAALRKEIKEQGLATIEEDTSPLDKVILVVERSIKDLRIIQSAHQDMLNVLGNKDVGSSEELFVLVFGAGGAEIQQKQATHILEFEQHLARLKQHRDQASKAIEDNKKRRKDAENAARAYREAREEVERLKNVYARVLEADNIDQLVAWADGGSRDPHVCEQ